MTDDDRKFLTEAMGECWHDDGKFEDIRGDTWPSGAWARCPKCDRLKYTVKDRTFTTWTDFGAVWEWAQKQEWWDGFTDSYYHCCRTDLDMIDPLRFPQLVVDFLKERKP